MNNIIPIIIAGLSSTVIASLISLISNYFNSKNSKTIEFEQEKFELLFSEVDFSIQKFLFFVPNSNVLPEDFSEIITKIISIIEKNPKLELSLGTRFKENLLLLANPKVKNKKTLKKRINSFSIYYSYELKQCKKILKFPRYSLLYPKGFLTKQTALLRKTIDLIEDFMNGITLVCFLLIILMMYYYFIFKV